LKLNRLRPIIWIIIIKMDNVVACPAKVILAHDRVVLFNE